MMINNNNDDDDDDDDDDHNRSKPPDSKPDSPQGFQRAYFFNVEKKHEIRRWKNAIHPTSWPPSSWNALHLDVHVADQARLACPWPLFLATITMGNWPGVKGRGGWQPCKLRENREFVC